MTDSIRIEKNENLCSIFHARFKHLRTIIPNIKQAQLMDYILLGWQSSTYKLKNSNQKWFMKEYPKIVEDTGIALSSLKRYLKEFEDEGFIERRQALYSRITDSGFQVKKGCYISINQKLVDLLNSVEINVVNHEPIANTPQEIGSNDTICENFEKNETFEELNLSQPYIRDLYTSSNNTISQNFLVKNVDKNEQKRTETVLSSIEHTLYKEIKEEIPEEVKQLVFGTLANLVVKDKVFLSSPRQLAAEYLFSLINGDFFMKNVNCIKHRNNILAKLLREKRWQTPKGFYKHFYLGENYKDKNEIREKFWIKTKENKINDAVKLGFVLDEVRDPCLYEIDNKIGRVGQNIENLKESIYETRDPDLILEIRKTIEQQLTELHLLYNEQKRIEDEVGLCNQITIPLTGAVA